MSNTLKGCLIQKSIMFYTDFFIFFVLHIIVGRRARSPPLYLILLLKFCLSPSRTLHILQPITLFFNWDSFHARLNSHYKAWNYKKKKHKKIKAYSKSLQREPTVSRCLSILDLKPFRLQLKRKHSTGKKFQSLAKRGKKLLIMLANNACSACKCSFLCRFALLCFVGVNLHTSLKLVFAIFYQIFIFH